MVGVFVTISANVIVYSNDASHLKRAPTGSLAGTVVHSETVSVLVTISITVIVFLILRIATMPTLKRMVVHSDNHDGQ